MRSFRNFRLGDASDPELIKPSQRSGNKKTNATKQCAYMFSNRRHVYESSRCGILLTFVSLFVRLKSIRMRDGPACYCAVFTNKMSHMLYFRYSTDCSG